MLNAARLNDVGSAHGCFPPNQIIQKSDDVLINGLPAVRVGDAVAFHGCLTCPPHGRNIAQGSSSVVINDRPAARVGDAIDCGGVIETGSDDVMIG